MKDRDPVTGGLPGLRRPLSRRKALRTLGGASLLVPAAPYIVRRAFAADQPMGPGGIPLARPDKPVTLPLYEDAIKSEMAPETGGDFIVYVYADYIDKGLVTAFCKAHGVNMQLTTYDSQDEAITKQATHAVRPDVVNITPDRLAQAVAGKLIKPINHDYIPNLKGYVWDSLQSPFYDVGSRFTVPYTIYKTGIGWRTDKVKEDIAKLDNPWSIFWNAKAYTGYVGVLDDARESLTMAMLYRQFYDINTEEPNQINRAEKDLSQLTSIANVKVNVNDYTDIPSGATYISQAWSGDMATASQYLPKGVPPSVLGYWRPETKAETQNDMITILREAKHPVLAHTFLNFLLDNQIGLENVAWNGYMPPLTSVTPATVVAHGYIPENLTSTIVREADFKKGVTIDALTTTGESLWENAWSNFKAG